MKAIQSSKMLLTSTWWNGMDLSDYLSFITTLAVVIGVVIYHRQLAAMRRARELESLLIIMNQVDNINLRRTRHFMREHREELEALLGQQAPHNIEASVHDLSSGELSIHEIDLAINALNNVCFLIREKYAPPSAAEEFMRNSFLLAWKYFEPYVRYRRTLKDDIGEASQYAAHFEWVVRELSGR